MELDGLGFPLLLDDGCIDLVHGSEFRNYFVVIISAARVDVGIVKAWAE